MHVSKDLGCYLHSTTAYSQNEFLDIIVGCIGVCLPATTKYDGTLALRVCQDVKGCLHSILPVKSKEIYLRFGGLPLTIEISFLIIQYEIPNLNIP